MIRILYGVITVLIIASGIAIYQVTIITELRDFKDDAQWVWNSYKAYDESCQEYYDEWLSGNFPDEPLFNLETVRLLDLYEKCNRIAWYELEENMRLLFRND